MQVDSCSDITLLPVNFWHGLEKPRLKKSPLQLKQFDGTIIKTLSTFEVHLKLRITLELYLLQSWHVLKTMDC